MRKYILLKRDLPALCGPQNWQPSTLYLFSYQLLMKIDISPFAGKRPLRTQKTGKRTPLQIWGLKVSRPPITIDAWGWAGIPSGHC